MYFGISDPSQLLEYWGYPAIFVLVFLGNLGVPIPEETVLLVAGYLVWKGTLVFEIAAAVGILSAICGDNFGYFLGYQYGAPALLRYGRWVFITPDRIRKMEWFMTRYGALGIFLARFLPGLRFMAGPLAGTTSMSFVRFFIANLCGAVVYVPLMLSAGYGVGFGIGRILRRYEVTLGGPEPIILSMLVISAVAIIAWRALRSHPRP
ncbi:MAG TPA: DedA family protein [Candidatus Acidoferrales bacterium]|nr:DedA family protein [Candidatus Acidoferrales bacterium]